MKRDLNRILKLNNDSEHKSLYDWSLEEYDSEGDKVTSSFIPMQTGSIILGVEKLEYRHNFEGLGWEPDTAGISESEFITGTLKTKADAREDISTTNSFSMFGTDRKIKTVGIEIHKVDNDYRTEESFNLSGHIGYETEADMDLPAQKAEDALIISVVLNEERFNKIVQYIKDGIYPSYVTIGDAEGIYNQWSPSIHLGDIKILTDEMDYTKDNSFQQQLEIPKDCDIKPPRLGKLNEFDFGFLISSAKSVDKDNENEDEDYFEDDYESDISDEKESPIDVISSQLSEMSNFSMQAFKYLKTPLWIIAITLLLILFYK
mgnify:FL=1